MKRQAGFTFAEFVLVLGVLIIMAVLAWVNIMAGADQAGLSFGVSQKSSEMCDECVESRACHKLWLWENRQARPVLSCNED